MQRFYILLLLFAITACKTRKQYVPPVAVEVKHPVKDSIVQNEKKISEKLTKKKFKLTLLLALNAQQYLEKDSTGNYSNQDMEPLHLTALQFYEGLQLARESNDSLISIRVFDAGADSIKILKMLRDSVFLQSDMVVSVVNSSFIPAILKISAEKNFPLMVPFNQSALSANGYSKSWIANPSNKTQCRKMAAYLKKNNPGANFIVIYRGDVKKETDLALLFNDELQLLLKDSVRRKIDYLKDGWDKLHKALVKNHRNILIIPTSDQSFLSTLLIKLDKEEQYNFLIAGIPTWDHFESIDFSLFERMNTYIFNANFIDFENEKVRLFRKQFIEKYHTDPLFAAYSGFDIHRWITTNFTAFGNELEKYTSTTTLTAPGEGFKFERSCEKCGFENQYISILQFKEGTLKKVDQQ